MQKRNCQFSFRNGLSFYSRDKNTQLGAKLEGVKIQKFYEEVLSSESKGAKPQTSESLKRKAGKILILKY